MQTETSPKTLSDYKVFTEELLKELEKKDDRIADLESILLKLKRKIFASSSETISSDQLGFTFDEAEDIQSSAPEDEEAETISYTRKKKKGRKPIPDHIPREEVVIDVPEEERFCSCGHEYKEIGSEDSEKLEYTPAKLKVIKTRRIKRACECEQCQAVIVAPQEASIIPKSIATASLLAFICVSKYVDHLSLYRIANIFSCLKVDLSRQTLASWMIRLGIEITPLINLMEEHLLSGDYIFCDETRVQVLKEPGKTAQSRSQMWVRARNGPQPIVLFDYDPTRQGKVAERLLEGFRGYLHVDGYSGYNAPSENEYVVRVADMYHIRRKFKDAYEEAKVNHGDKGPSSEALGMIKELSKIEEKLKGKSDFERFHTRLKKSKPVMDRFKKWMDIKKQEYRPQSSMGVAINYALGQWDDMMMFLSHGKLEITTNFVENKIRPFALGRKNWLFSTSVDGVKSSAQIYSLIESAKANGLEPMEYLKEVFEKIPHAKSVDDFEALLPWNYKKS